MPINGSVLESNFPKTDMDKTILYYACKQVM